MFFIVFSIIIQYVSIAAVPYRVQQHLILCCATIQGGTAILPFCSVLLRHHTGCNSKKKPPCPIVVAAAPHRVQQQNAIMKVFSANRVVKATTKSVLYILFSFFRVVGIKKIM